MKVDELEKIINQAFDNKQNISEKSDKKIIDAINETIELTDKGTVRVANKHNNSWTVNQWVKKAILLSFRINKMTNQLLPLLLHRINLLNLMLPK